MQCRDLLPLGLIGLVAALIIALLSSHSGNAPYTTDLVRNGSADQLHPFVYTDIAFGSQSFKVLLDTGSSDTWLASSDFTCIINQKGHPQADCGIGPLYHIDDAFTEIRGEMLHVLYSPMHITGIPGTAPVTLAGLTTTAEVGVVNRLSDPFMESWASGLLGLGFSPGTSNFPADSTATNGTNDEPTDNLTNIPSKSIMSEIFKQKKIPRKFSLATSRGEINSSDAGTFTIGGLPNLRDPRVNASTEFASANFQAAIDQVSIGIGGSIPKLIWYTFLVDGLYYGTLGNLTVNTTPTQYILDSGISLIQLPEADALRWLSMFDPPGNPANFEVKCNATVPNLELRIGGKLFFMNPIDLVEERSGFCRSRVLKGSPGSPNFLGDAFLRNVVAVFDWENEQMQFASRPYYKS